MRCEEASTGALNEDAQVYPMRKSFLSKNLTRTNSHPPLHITIFFNSCFTFVV